MSATLRHHKPPVLADTRAVPQEEMLHYRHGKNLNRTLGELGLGCFSDQIGSYWFGVADPAFPEHDRWFYRVSFQALEEARNSWKDALYYEIDRCGTRLQAIDSEFSDFPFDMAELAGMIQDVIERLSSEGKHAQTPAEIARLKHNALHTFQAFGFLGLDQHGVGARWDQDLHDLVRHPEVWAATHPEFDQAPRGMVLRMHGLKSYADNLANGGDWLRF